ncbi:exo-alpha-sialidase [Oerskovia sp. KBS0722]|uniref:sialidase family protein n=1 Tax=Oerskovia sp. KBS0722 TaxID=1179673 RepID=UPI00110F4123|nr:sialidase family protein [Oerskovia sp. KBS0722]QDW63780.1 exo-alpha-sialidase [Oerskovia sp. KBS0722]
MPLHPPTPPSAAPPCTRRRSRAALAAGLSLLLVAPVASAQAFDPFPPAATDGPGTFSEQTLAVGGTGGYANYRIPALTTTNDGTILASYDGRPFNAGDAPQPNSILQRVSRDGGATWEPTTVVAAGYGTTSSPDKYGFSDPSYVVDRETGAIFNFHVKSFDQGFGGSATGVDPTNRQILHAAVSVSEDGGETWEGRVITEGAKDPSWAGIFAASGEGIQLRYGEHAGRLVQQFTARTGGTYKAYSVYSDDHGATWQHGEAFGTGMDENKSVELSDGRVLMNSRDSAGSKYRKVAFSQDGGHTYGPVTLDRQLPDPTNNGSVSRLYPDAPEGSAEAKMLLFSNSNSTTGRENVTVRLSCDDGATWPGFRVVNPGSGAYSTLSPIGDGRFGLLYETQGMNAISFASFDQKWLNATCASTVVPDTTVATGGTVQVLVKVTNQNQAPLAASRLTIDAPVGWSATTVDVPALAVGQTATVQVALTASATAAATTAANPVRVQSVLTAADGTQARAYGYVTVTGGPAGPVTSLAVFGKYTTDRDVAAQPYAVGERVPYSFRVYNTGTTAYRSTATGNLTNLSPGCNWSSLPAGGTYLCALAYRVVTAGDLADGFFVPETRWSMNADQASSVALTGSPVDLVDRRPSLGATTGEPTVEDTDGNGSVNAGDVVVNQVTVRNTGNVRLTGVGATGLCTMPALAAGAEASCGTVRRTLTAADVAAGSLAGRTVTVSASNGELAVTGRVDVAPYELPAQPVVPVEVTASAQCVAGKVQLTGRAVNAGDEALDVTIRSTAGTKAFAGLAPGRSASQRFATRSASVAAGQVSFDVTAGGATSTLVAPYDATSC